MKKNYLFNWLSVLLFSFLLVGCSAEEKTTVEKQEEVVEEVKEYTVTDDVGNEITFEEVPETIVSLQPSNTEILFALGVGDKIVGATDYDTYPAEALEIERVSDSVAFNAERITELNPDVVIAYTIGQEEALQLLEDTGLKVFVIESATSFEDVYGDIEQLATVMGIEEKGQEVISSIQDTIQGVQERVKSATSFKKVYYEISPSPDIYTTGSKTFQQEILAAASVDNVFSDQEGWISVSEEDVTVKNPEIILTTANYLDDAPGEIKSRAGWDKIQAVQNDSVFLVDGDVISRPGPRIGEAVELIAKTVYPELFQ